MSDKPLIFVAVPASWLYIPTFFFVSWTQMITRALGKFQLHISFISQSLIEDMREGLAKIFLGSPAKVSIWFDADQEYPADTIEKLYDHYVNGYEVVGGVTPHRATSMPMVYKFNPETYKYDQIDPFPLNRGLVEVDAMGFGGVMVARSVFEKIEPPYFERFRIKRGVQRYGEDFCFFHRCREKGIKIYADTDLLYKHIVNVPIGIGEIQKTE